MKGRPPQSLGDLLRAFVRLKVDDDSTRKEVAQMLGLALYADEAAQRPKPKPLTLKSVRRVEEEPLPASPGAVKNAPASGAAIPATGRNIIAQSASKPEATSILVEESSTPEPPDWLGDILPEEDARNLEDTMPLAPLLSPSLSRAIWTAALARYAAEGEPDVEQLVDDHANGRPLVALPRRLLPTLRYGAQLIVDQSEAMQPFMEDQVALVQQLRHVVGADLLQVHYTSGLPIWRDLAAFSYRLPAAGTPVLCLTDLGIGQPPLQLDRISARDWCDLAAQLAARGCPLVALVPYPPSRWPQGLSRQMTILQWDRPLTVGGVARSMSRFRRDRR